VNLPALLLSKIVDPDSLRGPSSRWGVLLPEDLDSFKHYS